MGYYLLPGCIGDGAWMVWENSSAAVAVAAAVVAHLGPNLELSIECLALST